MSVLAPFVVHVAAPPVGWVQACAACGLVLIDNTAWGEGRVAVREGDDQGPAWWPVGERIACGVYSDGRSGMMYVLGPPGRPLADDERLCAGAN